MNTSLLTKWGPNSHLLGRWASYSVCGSYVDPPAPTPPWIPPPAIPENGAPGITTIRFNHSYHGGRININSCQDLQYLRFPNMTECDGQYFVNNNPALKEVSFPVLTKWQFGKNRISAPYVGGYYIMQISSNPLLELIDFGPWVPNGAWDVDVSRNPNLTQACVDDIVTRFVNATNWRVNLNPTPPPYWRCVLKLYGSPLPSPGVQAAANVVNADPTRNVLIDWLYP